MISGKGRRYKHERCHSPIITNDVRAVDKMAGKLAMLAVLLSCKRLCVSELRNLPYNVITCTSLAAPGDMRSQGLFDMFQ